MSLLSHTKTREREDVKAYSEMRYKSCLAIITEVAVVLCLSFPALNIKSFKSMIAKCVIFGGTLLEEV